MVDFDIVSAISNQFCHDDLDFKDFFRSYFPIKIRLDYYLRPRWFNCLSLLVIAKYDLKQKIGEY